MSHLRRARQPLTVRIQRLLENDPNRDTVPIHPNDEQEMHQNSQEIHRIIGYRKLRMMSPDKWRIRAGADSGQDNFSTEVVRELRLEPGGSHV